LEETFHAALADPGAAQQLLAGCLTNALAHHGYDLGTGNPTPARTRSKPSTSRERTPADHPSAESRRRSEQRSRLERELGEAWALARQAADERDGAAEEAHRAGRARADIEREVTRLRGELADAEAALESTGQADEAARTAGKSADRAAQKSRQRVSGLQSRLDNL